MPKDGLTPHLASNLPPILLSTSPSLCTSFPSSLLCVVTQPHQQQKVTQYQVSSWSEEGLAQDNRALLELIEKVAATQRRTGNNPIVVHGV